jgi:hypothetical protein
MRGDARIRHGDARRNVVDRGFEPSVSWLAARRCFDPFPGDPMSNKSVSCLVGLALLGVPAFAIAAIQRTFVNSNGDGHCPSH